MVCRCQKINPHGFTSEIFMGVSRADDALDAMFKLIGDDNSFHFRDGAIQDYTSKLVTLITQIQITLTLHSFISLFIKLQEREKELKKIEVYPFY